MTTDNRVPLQQIRAAGTRSIAADRIGTAITGNFVLPPDASHAAERTDAAQGMSNLLPAGLCLGREEQLTWLRRTLTGSGEGVITQGGLVHGLGGIGKSTLALHYAHRHRADYTLVWWLNAASPDEIETSLTHLTHALVPDWAAGAERGGLVAWALRWLAWHEDWLLVYDNVDEPDDLTPYLGALHRGHHLATSRRATGWPDSVVTWPLGALDPEDATDLLCRLVFKDSAPEPQERADARALVTELGFLPLAVRQAGAYLSRNRGVRIDDYRRRLDTKLDKAVPGRDAERTVARIWTVTLQVLEQTDPRAVDVLYTAAWLAPDDIPHTLLSPVGADPDDTAEAIGTLADYSMVTDNGTTLGVHRLVQTVLRNHPPRTPDDPAASRSGAGRLRAEQAVLDHLTPPTGRQVTTDDQWDALTSHLITLAATTPPQQGTDTLTAAYDSAAHRLHEQGHTARAIPLFETTLAQREQALGDTHRDTLASRNNLAHAYSSAGDLTRAVPLYETTLAQREQVLGDTHPDTLASRNNLAHAYSSAGDLTRAVPLLETTLAQREQVLGDTHPDTLTSRNNLAHAYKSAGDLTRAVPLFETTLAQREQVLGDTHPDTLTSRNNLAHAYLSAGDLTRAVPLFETTLAQCVQVLGDTHPDTLTSRNNLAHAYLSAGDLTRAVPLFETTLAQCVQVLGDTHPDTLTSRNNLADAYSSAGDLTRAVPLYETTLAQCVQVLGDTHPDTLTSRNNLADAYSSAGDLTRAVPLYETTLAQCVQVLGDTHPDTLTSRNNLACAYKSAGDLTRAIPLFETTLAQCVQVLGDTHPDTLASRNNLAYAYKSAGDLTRAIPLFETALAQCVQVLGDTHPNTAAVRGNLASARGAVKDVGR